MELSRCRAAAALLRVWNLAPSATMVLLALSCLSGCSGGGSSDGGGGRQFLSMGTAPVGGAFNPVGNALSEVLNEYKGENNWKVQAKGTKGSQENIRRLQKGVLQLALSNSAITYFAVRGDRGWDQKYDMRAIVTMAPNVAMFITKKDSGITTIADLKGKRVVCGPAGAGFDQFVEPLINAHGVTYDDFTKLNNNQNGAVDMLADGQADAAFLGGAIPTSSIQRACSEQDIYFIPFDDQAKAQLVDEYPFFQPITVTADKYSDLTEDYAGMNVGSMHLITAAEQPDELIYQITKTLWEHRAAIAHPAAKFIHEENAARYTGTEFHAGAIRYYQEIGIWPESTGPGDPSAENGDCAGGQCGGDPSTDADPEPAPDAHNATDTGTEAGPDGAE